MYIKLILEDKDDVMSRLKKAYARNQKMTAEENELDRSHPSRTPEKILSFNGQKYCFQGYKLFKIVLHGKRLKGESRKGMGKIPEQQEETIFWGFSYAIKNGCERIIVHNDHIFAIYKNNMLYDKPELDSSKLAEDKAADADYYLDTDRSVFKKSLDDPENYVLLGKLISFDNTSDKVIIGADEAGNRSTLFIVRAPEADPDEDFARLVEILANKIDDEIPDIKEIAKDINNKEVLLALAELIKEFLSQQRMIKNRVRFAPGEFLRSVEFFSEKLRALLIKDQVPRNLLILENDIPELAVCLAFRKIKGHHFAKALDDKQITELFHLLTR